MAEPLDHDQAAIEALLHDLIAEFHDRIDQGEALDPVAFSAEHPEQEAELSRYFENVATLEILAGPRASQVETGTTGVDPAATVISGETRDGSPAETMIEDSRSGDRARISNDAPRTQFGRYRIVQELGRGAMGAVYLAHDELLDREVALKIPQFDAGINDDLLERFYREARAAAALQHSGICPVYDVGELDGQHYITMAFIKGRPLRDFTKSSKRQKGKQVARVIRKVAMAMSEAHDHNVVHRDLKPANIMINDKNEPVVMDFGLARRSTEGEERLTHTGTVIGTPAYMSPEQVDGDNNHVGPHSDVYSLGVIFYEMLTGQLPFQGNLMSILKQISMSEPKTPIEIHADIDPSLQAICLSMMSKKKEDRPASMSDVARDLTMWLQGRQIVADETEPLESSQVSAIPAARGDETTAALTDDPVAATMTRESESASSHSEGGVGNGGRAKSRLPLIAGVFGGAVVLLAGIMFIVQLGKVKVQITLDDPSYSLRVDGDALLLEGGSNEIRLSADEHRLTVMQGDLVVDAPKSFTVKKDGKNAITVFVVNNKVMILPDGEQPPALLDEEPLPGALNPSLTGESVDLLALLDPERDFPFQHQKDRQLHLEGGVLRTPESSIKATGIFRVPVPEQYDIQLQLELQSDRGNGFVVGIVMGGQQATIGMDAGMVKPVWAMENVDGQSLRETSNPARRVGRRLRVGHVDNVTISVRKDRVMLTHDNETIFNWQGTPDQLSLAISDDLPAEPCLFFRSRAPFLIHKMTMTPIDGSSTDTAIASSTDVWAPDWEWAKPIDLGEPEAPSELELASVDGLSTLLFEAGKPGPRDIWQRDRLPGTSTWSKPRKLGSLINTASDDASPFLSRDGKTLIFESDRSGGAGKGDLWISTRNDINTPWSEPVNMGTNVNSTQSEGLATLSADGLQLIFASDRPGSTGLSDLWECRRESTKVPWSPARNIKSLNSVGRDLAPLLSRDGLSLVLTSDRLGGEGSADLWLSRRSSLDGPWSEPINLGPDVNTTGFEYGLILSADSRLLIYNSNPGGKRSTRLSRRVRKSRSNASQAPPLDNVPFNRRFESVQALEFDGQRSIVEVPTLKCDGVTAITVEGWLNPDEKRRSNAFNFVMPRGHSLTLQVGGFARWEFGGGIIDRNVYQWVHGPVIDQWKQRTHVAGIFADGQFTLFVNGKRAKPKPAPDGFSPSGLFSIGRKPWDEKEQTAYIGTIDEVRISSIVRYTEDFTPEQRFESDADTLALYHFEEGQGDVLKDSSGNDHHGKIIDADWVRIDGAPSQQIDLLANVEAADLNSQNMKWEFNAGVLTGKGVATTADKRWSGVRFPHEIRGAYDLELELKQSGFAPLQIDLPLGDEHAIRVHLGGLGSALMVIDGKQDKDAAEPHRNDNARMKKNVWHRLTAKVRYDGEEVNVDAALDGLVIGRFSGARSRISLPGWVEPDPIHVKMSGFELHPPVELSFRRAVVSMVGADIVGQLPARR